ncbi:MAG TPA: sugar phosphate isomerase/epimerase family protein [Syntrophales bacterium]|nr:sugar phosphate isomerase/epimerase family protein [Syntrophales bacterium]HPQ44138.1 sugar phosphate isomerase/epimerase family protein [Syntrophales bacterium]
MREILKKVQVNMPFRMLVDEYLDIVLEEGIHPEVGLDCFALDRFSTDEFHAVADRLHDAGLPITLHAPFFDLRPGAIDRKVREVTIERFRQVFDLAVFFRPRSVVCHAAFDEKYYVSNEDVWLENSRDTWSRFIETADKVGTKIAIENVYEGSPKYLGLLLDAFRGSQNVCLCFDTGHFNAFSESTLDEWMNVLGSRIGHIHLHDNDGRVDEHKPVGEGTFPFNRFFELLEKMNVRPTVTLEPHKVENLWRTLENIKRMGLLDYLGE